MSLLVIVADNFHYMDESANYDLGTFETAESAIEACKRIVDEFLVSAHCPGITAQSLYMSYIMFGEDPYIVSQGEDVAFSAWTYAKQRCELLCAANSEDDSSERAES